MFFIQKVDKSLQDTHIMYTLSILAAAVSILHTEPFRKEWKGQTGKLAAYCNPCTTFWGTLVVSKSRHKVLWGGSWDCAATEFTIFSLWSIHRQGWHIFAWQDVLTEIIWKAVETLPPTLAPLTWTSLCRAWIFNQPSNWGWLPFRRFVCGTEVHFGPPQGCGWHQECHNWQTAIDVSWWCTTDKSHILRIWEEREMMWEKTIRENMCSMKLRNLIPQGMCLLCYIF